MLRRFLGTRRGFWVIFALEALLLFFILPRALKGTGGPVYLASFWGIATLLYLGNHRVWRWLQCPRRD